MQTSLREARNSVSSANAVFYDAKDVDSVMLEDSEKIYQEIPDPKKIRKSSSSSSTTTVEELYDDAQVVTRRSKKKAAPPPPPPKPKRVIEDIYDDIELQVRKSSNPQDLEEARKSYQEAPEKYRKPSNYIDLESKGDSPLVKKEIEKMISTLGEVQSSSSSSSSSESESSKPETFQRRKSSYSSPSEIEVQEVEEEADVFSINTNPISIDSDEGSEKVQKMPAPLRRVANVDLGSSLEQALEGDLSDSGTSDSDTTTSGSETLDESEEGSKFEPPQMDPPELKNAIELLKEIEPEMIELKQAVELEMPTVQDTEPLDHFEPETVIDLAEPEAKVQPKSSSSHSSSSSSSEDEQLLVISHEPQNFEPEPLIEHHRPEFATQVIDEGHEVHLCTPVVVRTDDSSSEVEVKPMTKITEESTSESSTSEESSSSAESSSSEPGKESQPQLERKSSSSSSKLPSKSSSRSSSKLEIKPQSSSSEDELQVQSNGVDHRYANLPPRTSKSLSLPRRKRSSSSSSSHSSSSPKAQPKVRAKLKTRNSDISDSFLRNLNRNYQPVYYLRKVNSETQTDKGAGSNSTEA